MKLTFLGTSGSTPTRERSMPAVSIEHEGDIFLFDCGEGAQRQMMNFGVNLSRIKAIFVTHTHGDHIIGIAGLVRTLALNQRQKPLTIYVPKGEESMIKILLTFDKALMSYPINIIGIGAGTIYKGKDFTVSAFRLNHSISTFGYVFRENNRTNFMKEKCAKLGIKGTMFRDLQKKGSLKVGNRTIKLKDVSTEKPGRSIVYAADTRPCASTVNAAKGAEILIHESSFKSELIAHAKQRHHSTVEEAAHVAKKAKCKKLFLYHISARYKDSSVLLKEAKQIFNNTEVAKDGLQVVL